MYRRFSLNDEKLEDFKRGNFVIRFLRFNAPFKSETEVHKKVNDMYIVYSGKAKVLLSDDYEGGREIEPYEIRGCNILNYETIDMKSGDVLFIPANTSHQLLVEEGSLTIVIIKILEE